MKKKFREAMRIVVIGICVVALIASTLYLVNYRSNRATAKAVVEKTQTDE